jgi:hypothetical protein
MPSFLTWEWESLVDVVTRLKDGRSGFRIPENAKDTSLIQNVQKKTKCSLLFNE